MVIFVYIYNTVVHISFNHALDQDQEHRGHTKPLYGPPWPTNNTIIMTLYIPCTHVRTYTVHTYVYLLYYNYCKIHAMCKHTPVHE